MKAAVILAGQSNMVGHGDLSALEAPVLPANARLFDLNPRDGCFGPEVGFARRFLELAPLDELWLIKYAVGGSSLLAWEKGWTAERAATAHDDDKGALYPRLLSHARRVIGSAGIGLLACLWMQGESDSRYPLAASEYRQNLRRLIADIRADLRQPRLQFVIGRVNPAGDQFAWLPTVRAAQEKIARSVPHVCLVDADDLTKHEDGIHYDSGGQLELGARFARRLLQDL